MHEFVDLFCIEVPIEADGIYDEVVYEVSYVGDVIVITR